MEIVGESTQKLSHLTKKIEKSKNSLTFVTVETCGTKATFVILLRKTKSIGSRTSNDVPSQAKSHSKPMK